MCVTMNEFDNARVWYVSHVSGMFVLLQLQFDFLFALLQLQLPVCIASTSTSIVKECQERMFKLSPQFFKQRVVSFHFASFRFFVIMLYVLRAHRKSNTVYNKAVLVFLSLLRIQ